MQDLIGCAADLEILELQEETLIFQETLTLHASQTKVYHFFILHLLQSHTIYCSTAALC